MNDLVWFCSLDETYARFSLEANWKAATGSKRQSEHTTTSDAEPSKKKKKKEKSNLVEHIDLTGESAAKAAKLVNRRKSIVTEQCKAIAADKKNGTKFNWTFILINYLIRHLFCIKRLTDSLSSFTFSKYHPQTTWSREFEAYEILLCLLSRPGELQSN